MINISKHLMLEKILLRESLLRIPQNIIDQCEQEFEIAKKEYEKFKNPSFISKVKSFFSKQQPIEDFKYQNSLEFNLYDLFSFLNLKENIRIYPYFLFFLNKNEIDVTDYNKEIFDSLEEFKENIEHRLESTYQEIIAMKSKFNYGNLFRDAIFKKLFLKNENSIKTKMEEKKFKIKINFDEKGMESVAESHPISFENDTDIILAEIQFSPLHYFLNSNPEQEFHNDLIHELSHSIQKIINFIMNKNKKFVFYLKFYKTYFGKSPKEHLKYKKRLSDNIRERKAIPTDILFELKEEIENENGKLGNPNPLESIQSELELHSLIFNPVEATPKDLKRREKNIKKHDIGYGYNPYGRTSRNIPPLHVSSEFSEEDLKSQGYFKNINIKNATQIDQLNNLAKKIYKFDMFNFELDKEVVNEMVATWLDKFNLASNTSLNYEITNIFFKNLPESTAKENISNSIIRNIITSIKNFILDNKEIQADKKNIMIDQIFLLFFDQSPQDLLGHITTDEEYFQILDTMLRRSIINFLKSKKRGEKQKKLNLNQNDLSDLLEFLNARNDSFFKFNFEHRPEFPKHIKRNLNKIIYDPIFQKRLNYTISSN